MTVQNRLLDTFLDLVKTPSPSIRERAVADYITARAESFGYEVVEDNAGDMLGSQTGNLIIRSPGNGNGLRLVFMSHMDTVESGDRPVNPIVDGFRVTSDRSSILGADDKSGITIMLELLARIKEQKIEHNDLLFIFTVCEENELLGSSALTPEWYENYDAGIVLDHSNPNEILIGGPSKVALRITVFGVGGHGAHPAGTVNAAHTMATAISRLPSGRLDNLTTACIGVMRSGHKINVVPDRAYAEYEIRSHRKDLLDYHLKRSIAIVEGAVREERSFVMKDEDNPVRKAMVDVEVEACYEAWKHDEDTLPVRIMSQAIRDCGTDPVLKLGSGGSDAHNLNSHGLQSVVFGTGMHNVHCPAEYLDIDEMKKSVEVLMRAMQMK